MGGGKKNIFFFYVFWDLALIPSDSPSNSMHFALLDASVSQFFLILVFFLCFRNVLFDI